MKKKTYRKIFMYAAILAATICFVDRKSVV